MKQWKKLYGLSGTFECPYCYKTLPISEASRDHKQPKSRFGNNNPKNITICCRHCNSEKSALTPEEYKLWLLLNKVRNGNKDKDLIANLELVMMVLEEKHYRGKYL